MLEGINLLSSLTKEELATLESFCQERTFQRGEVLFNEGDEATAMYILKSGLLEVYDCRGFIGIIKPGDFFGEMGIFSPGKTRTASVRAIEDSTVVVLLSFLVEELGKKYPEILEKIRKVIKERGLENQAKRKIKT